MPVSYSAFQLIANTSLNSNRQPVVSFMFDVGGGFSAYDVVTFSFATQLDYSDDFIVDGYTSNPAGLAYDAEWIMGGPGGGASTIDESSNLQLGLQYWNGNNYESINNATDYGEDTGESIGTAYVTGEFYDSDGALFAQVSSGSENPGVLWYATYIAIVDVQGPGSSNATVIPGAGGVPYIGGIAAIAIGATSLDFQVACNGFTDDLGTHSLAPGSTTILTVGPWAWVNFTESGLPSASSWGVSVGSTASSASEQKAGTGTSFAFYLPVDLQVLVHSLRGLRLPSNTLGWCSLIWGFWPGCSDGLGGRPRLIEPGEWECRRGAACHVHGKPHGGNYWRFLRMDQSADRLLHRELG